MQGTSADENAGPGIFRQLPTSRCVRLSVRMGRQSMSVQPSTVRVDRVPPLFRSRRDTGVRRSKPERMRDVSAVQCRPTYWTPSSVRWSHLLMSKCVRAGSVGSNPERVSSVS